MSHFPQFPCEAFLKNNGDQNLFFSGGIYNVVDFLEMSPKETSTVPNGWIVIEEKQPFCYWPTGYSKAEIVRAIKSNEVPDKDKWHCYLVKIQFEGN